MSPATRSAAVIGGGIGGLAAGIALRRAGLEVEVHEGADEIRPLGAGLSIWPNGVRALRALGLGAWPTRPGCTRGRGPAARRRLGARRVRRRRDRGRYGAPLVGVNRGDLHAALLAGWATRAAPRFAPRSDDGTLRFADGTSRVRRADRRRRRPALDRPRRAGR